MLWFGSMFGYDPQLKFNPTPYLLRLFCCVQAQAVISVKLLEMFMQNSLPISLMHFVQVLLALGDRLLYNRTTSNYIWESVPYGANRYSDKLSQQRQITGYLSTWLLRIYLLHTKDNVNRTPRPNLENGIRLDIGEKKAISPKLFSQFCSFLIKISGW